MASSFQKFYSFPTALTNGVHNFSSHTFKVFLTNEAPDSANDALYADINELSSGNGYTTGGKTVTVTKSNTSGTEKIIITDPSPWEAAGGAIGPFQYVVVRNASAAGEPLVGFWNKGSAITLAEGERFTADFDQTAGIFSIS